VGDILFCDFETRSPVDIKKAGADVYARDPHARVMAFGYCFNDDNVTVNKMGQAPPAKVIDHVRSGGYVVAHNAPFEWVIWNYCWRREFYLPEIKIEQMICTMSMAYACGLPGSLEKSSAAAGIDMQKDMQGNRIMLQLAAPKEGPTFWGTYLWHEPEIFEEKFNRMYEYCAKDVEVERKLYKRLVQLSPNEKQIWYLDHKINQRGVYIDIPSVRNALELVEFERKRLNKRMQDITNGAVATCNATKQLTDWILDQGVKVESIAKADILELLNEITLPDNIREALLTRQEAAKSSNAKLQSMIESVCDDNRARSLFQYHGAGTGRWAGRRIQVQNLPRSKISLKEIEGVIGLLNGDGNNF